MIGGQALRLGEGDEGQEKSTLQIDDERGGEGGGGGWSKNQIIINKLINLKNLINYLLTVDSLGRALSKHFLTVPVACRPQHSVDEDPVKIDEYLHQRLVLYSHF